MTRPKSARTGKKPGNAPGQNWREGVYKFDDVKKAEYLRLLREGGRRHQSARQVGVTPMTVINHQAADPEFKRACEMAEMEALDEVESAIHMAAASGNVTACIFILQNRDPDRWKDMRFTEVKGKVEVDWQE